MNYKNQELKKLIILPLNGPYSPKRCQGCGFEKSGLKPAKELKIQLCQAVFYAVFPIFVVFTLCGAVPRSHFLTLGPGISAQARGDVFTSNGDDMSVFYYNPSLLAGLPCPEITGGYWFLFDNARYNFVGFSTRLKQHAFALAGTQVFRGNIEVRQNIDDEPELTQNNQMAVYGSYALGFRKLKASIGCNIKYVYHKLHTQENSCVNFDAGLAKQLLTVGNPKGVNFRIDTGFVIQNFIQSLTLTGTDTGNELPQIMKLGAGISFTIFPRYNKNTNILTYDELTVACDIIRRENQNMFAVGAQYRLMNLIILRAGYNNGITAGFGVNYQNYQLDYAFVPKDLAWFHKIGFTYRLKGIVRTDGEITETKFKDEFQEVYKKAGRLYEINYREAKQLMEGKNYDESLRLLNKTIPLKPGRNKKAFELLKVCQEAIKAIQQNKDSVLTVQDNTGRIHDLVSSGVQSLNSGDFAEAYNYFYKAQKLAPEDKSIGEQKELAKQKWLKQKKFTIADKVYADKLYYLTAIAIATGEDHTKLLEELRNFNPVYEWLPLLETDGK